MEETAAVGEEGVRRRVAEAPQKHGHQRVLPHGERKGISSPNLENDSYFLIVGLHLRHHRASEGRDAVPRQPDHDRPDRLRDVRPRPGGGRHLRILPPAQPHRGQRRRRLHLHQSVSWMQNSMGMVKQLVLLLRDKAYRLPLAG